MKTALIIGASGGIGYETAALFLKEDFRVINVSRTPCALPGVENKLCDVTDRPKLDEILSEITRNERLDAFVYSAGFSMACPLEFVKEGDYRYLFEVNFFAFVHCLQTLLPLLKQSDGAAVAVSSLAAELPIPFDAYYTASKAALNAFVDALSYELDTETVRVTALLPGGTKTGFTDKRKVYPPPLVDGYNKQLVLATDSLARMEQNGASPKKVAKAVLNACLCPKMPLSAPTLLSKAFRLIKKIFPAAIVRAAIRTAFFTEE